MNHSEKKPNFLIITAPKTGSTSLVNYLREHPQIFISYPGEPRYFIRDIIKKLPTEDTMRDYLLKSSFLTWNDYINLFSLANDNEIMLGEGTTQYLYYHNEVIPQIKEKLGDIPIIILLRNPTDRAFSNYNFQPTGQFLSFEDALQKEEERKKNNFFSFWLYKEQGMYCEAVKAYKNNFSKVTFLLTDDLKDRPIETMKDLYSFLGVDNSFIPKTNSHHNVTKIPKNKIIHFIIYFLNKHNIKLFFFSKHFKEKIRQKLFKNSNVRINTETKKQLNMFFKKDIICLENEIEKDLSNWYK